MTAEQIARCLPYGEKGQDLKPFKPKEQKRKILPGSYPKIADMLLRMVQAGELMRSRAHEGEAFIYMLNNANLKFPANWYNRRHELNAADIFVAYYLTGQLTHWDYKWTQEETKYYEIKKHRVYYDRRMVLDGKIFFWEVDRGTEDAEQLEDKIMKYQQFSEAYPKEWFYVLFAVENSRYYNVSERIKWLQKLLAKRTAGYQFLVTQQLAVTKHPLDAAFASYQTGELVSLLDLNSP